MDTDKIIELAFYTLPALITGGVAYFSFQTFTKNDENRRRFQLLKENQKQSLPLKLQAYERIVIFLERIHPNTMIVRVNKHGMTAQQFHIELVKTVKSEYEHNLSQQIYISYNAWELVKTAKEEIIKLINISATKVPHENSSNDLAMMILNITANLEKKIPTDVAVEYLKKEVSQIF